MGVGIRRDCGVRGCGIDPLFHRFQDKKIPLSDDLREQVIKWCVTFKQHLETSQILQSLGEFLMCARKYAFMQFQGPIEVATFSQI